MNKNTNYTSTIFKTYLLEQFPGKNLLIRLYKKITDNGIMKTMPNRRETFFNYLKGKFAYRTFSNIPP